MGVQNGFCSPAKVEQSFGAISTGFFFRKSRHEVSWVKVDCTGFCAESFDKKPFGTRDRVRTERFPCGETFVQRNAANLVSLIKNPEENPVENVLPPAKIAESFGPKFCAKLLRKIKNEKRKKIK